jgi:hypothetical protein
MRKPFAPIIATVIVFSVAMIVIPSSTFRNPVNVMATQQLK